MQAENRQPSQDQALPRCPRCGGFLLRAGMACTRRGCRPPALRRVRLHVPEEARVENAAHTSLEAEGLTLWWAR